MTHAFISYRSLESDFAKRLALDLRANKLAIWMDRLGGIEPGKDWIKALQDGVDTAKCFVAILSPAYVESSYCLNELQRAEHKKIPIIPILMKTVELPLELQRIQFIDFRNDYNAAILSLIASLNKLGVTSEQYHDENHYEGSMTPLREIDRQVQEITERLKKQSHSRKIARLESRLSMAIKRQEAASKQSLWTLNEADVPKLELLIQTLEEEIGNIEAELTSSGM